MNNKKGFTLVELIVSFALITAVSLAFFRTILVLQQEQLKNIARNSYKAFTVVLNNSIQKDFLNDNIEKIISCGENCYDITYTTNGIIRLSIDKENNTITYGNIKEKLPKDYKFINNIEFTSYINSYEGNDSYVALNLNIKSNYESKIENIKYVYQYDSDNGIIELNVDGANATDIIEYLLYTSPDENGLYEPLLPDGTSTGIRYRGSNPNNYVYFNCEDRDTNDIEYGNDDYDYENSCELWRIIGVFDVDNGKGNIEKRVKLVRSTVLSNKKAWDVSEDDLDRVNQWGETTLTSDNITPYLGASLKQYLNDGEASYYNSLSSMAKEQIDDALWHTSAVADGTAYEVYLSERSSLTGSSTIINYTTKWEGKIGLIYLSDFGYGGINCLNYTILNYSNSCGSTNNWLTILSEDYWTISPGVSNTANSWLIKSGGMSWRDGVRIGYGVRPSLYLKSNVTFIGDGTGTEESPYILGVNE